jgi:diacylglycerol kinase (ATP)
MQIAPDAKLNDGLFDICLVRATSKLEFMQTFPKVFAGKHTNHPKVEIRRARKVRIESEPRARVNVDGDIVGFTPIEFEMIPSALELIVPETFLAISA